MRESLKQLLIGFMIGLMLCPPSLVYAAGIQVDTSAPAANQATMDAAQNGVPVVNIAAPGGNGMSHNMFTDFNVSSQGVILNNSVAPGVSQLGGALAQNPNLGGQAASTILNEVTGTGRSSIEGFTEIFGQSATYILANPNGISINGGGFINTPRATMATGTPQFSNGAFQGIDVRGGDILIHGAGVNAADIDAFEIVTRAAQINADIHAKRLSIVTGQNRHNPVSGTTTPLAPDGSPAPTISIDSSALGGMYAGRITLVGTEAGVGVNTKGLVQSTEHLEMTVDGKIQVTNTVTSSGTMTLTSQDSIDVSGTVKAVGTATLNAPTVTVAKVDPADSPIISGGALAINAGTLNNGQLIAADTAATIAATTLNNTGTIYSGGTATFRIGDTLYNNRGTILAKNDMLLEGAVAGQRMATLQNDSGTIESLNGGLTFRATAFNNNNSQFTLVEGATELSYSEGGYWHYGNEGDECYSLFIHYIGTPRYGVGNTAHMLTQAQFAAAGVDPSRRVVTKDELLAVIAETDQKLAEDPNYLTASEKADLAYARSVANSGRTHIVAGVGSGVVYSATTTQDTATGQELGATIAAQGNILIEADDAKNSVSKITSASGDIIINANTFENVGRGVYERTTYKWGNGIFQNHNSPSVIPLGGGTEVALKATDYAYGTLDAGNRVVISSGAVTNGVTERNGIILPPDPAAQAQKVADVTTLTGALPANGLFQPNANPAHNYLIETNPALTNLDTFYGSDYALSRMGFDPNAEANKRLGDAFYETRLVREQIFELTGRRFFEDAVTSDTAQMVALMDNAVQAHSDLNLSVGVALSADQVAALTSDIVWFEYQEVNDQQVLVPVVYLGSTSLDRIIQGGSVIVGRDVLIEASGEVSNHGVMVAANDIEITANTIFNRQGSISGQAVGLTATDSVRVMGGIIKGDTVALKAGNDVVIASDTVEFKDRDTTATQIAMAGKVEAANSLSIEAGRDIGILGAEVAAGGDATLTAGENIAISTMETQTKSATSGSGYNSHSESVTNRRSTVTTGGTLTADAGADLAIHGSQIAADGDIALKAGGNVSITAATDSSDLYAHGEGGKGGFFGGKSSFTLENKNEHTVASTINAGGSVTVQAGAGGEGDLVLLGSQVKAAQDVNMKAEGDIQATPNRIENYHKFEEEKSGFMGTKSMASDESSAVAHTRPEIEAGGKVTLDAKDDVILQAARITSGDETGITAQDGQVAMLVVKDSEYKREVKSDMGFLTWSSSDKGNLDETVIHTFINADKGLTITTPQGVVVEFKESTGDVRKDAALLANVEGLQWMGDLLQRDDVDWVAVQEIHDQWSKSDGGLAPGGMLIVAIIASAVTAGAASSLAMAAMGLETALVNGVSTIVVSGTTTAASTAQLALYSALTAGITSLGSQVITSAADAVAGGDIGKNLGKIVSIDGLRSLTATMILAGALSASATSGTFAEMGEAGEYMATTAIQTATNTIVGGEDLQESFLSAVGSAFGRYSAGKIDASELDLEMKIIMHGVAGAAGAAATGGDPYAGAMGAIVAELAAPSIDQLLFDGTGKDGGTASTEGKTILAGSQIANVLASSLAGVDSNDAVASGRNAVMNNYLMPQEKKELVDKLESCGDDASCKQLVMAPYEKISDQRDDEFLAAETVCDSGDCSALLSLHYDLRLKLTMDGNEYYKNNSDEFLELPARESIWHTIEIDPFTGEPTNIFWGSNGNTKYVHPIYGYEVVIDEQGAIVTNSLNIGTYNFYNPNLGLDNPLLEGFFKHKQFDVNPYFSFGNAYDDPSSKVERYLRMLKLLSAW